MTMFGGGFGGPGAGNGDRGGGFGGGLGGGRGGGMAAPDSGLPFAGVPADLLAGVTALERTEPRRLPPPDEFLARAPDAPRLTLTRIVTGQPRLFATAVAAVVAETAFLQAGPLLVQIGIDHGIVARDLPVLTVAALAFGLSVLATALAASARIRAGGRLAAEAMRRLRVRIFGQLQRQSMDYFTTEKSGVIMTRMTSDIEAVQQLLQEGLSQFAIQILTMISVTVVLFAYNVELALFTVLLVLPPLAAASLWFRHAADRGYRWQRDSLGAMYADLSESLSGARVVTAHNRQERNTVAHRRVVGEYRDANDHTGHINALYGAGTSLVGMAGLGALLFVGGRMVLAGTLTIGELTAFVLYLNAFFQPMQQLVQLYTNYQQGRAAVQKLAELMLTPPTVPEAADAVDLPPIAGEIVFDDVRFGYDPDRPVLDGVRLRIAPGETIALVGPTGAGKSTLARLVTRLHDPDSGRVLVDGHDLRAVTFASLRRQVGIVPQEPYLFAGTLRDNIAFAVPDASDAQVWAAVDAVGLRGLVDGLGGLDALLHERGESVSAGERQLLALARVFLVQPRAVVLDEATSSLDAHAELQVEEALDRVLDGRTAILIAHRLTTALRADRVVVIDGGGIAEMGSPAELLERDGRFAAMYATWSRGHRLA